MASYDTFAAWYDPLYAATGKDHAAEAHAVLDLLSRLAPDGTPAAAPGSLLDVACGTGQHLAAFATRVADVVGLDAAPAMLDVARTRLEGVPLRHGDMRRFDLDRTFDVVTCLFSSIGHVRDEGDLDAAVAAMARHVAPGGALVVEPWLTPDAVVEGGVREVRTAETDAGVVARASRSARRGDVLVVEFAWSLATDEGVRTAEESFRMPLFTRERYATAVRAAGLEPGWHELPELAAGRGLLVGLRPVDDGSA